MEIKIEDRNCNLDKPKSDTEKVWDPGTAQLPVKPLTEDDENGFACKLCDYKSGRKGCLFFKTESFSGSFVLVS